jgi:hypothetical protein
MAKQRDGDDSELVAIARQKFSVAPLEVLSGRDPDGLLWPAHFVLRGDLDPLIWYLEQGGDFNDEIRDLVLCVLRGKWRRNRRPRSSARLLRELQISYFVAVKVSKGVHPKKARSLAATTFKASPSTVRDAVRNSPPHSLG